MPYTAYRMDPEWLKEETASKRVALKINHGMSDLLGFGMSVIAQRLETDPQRYRDYGPYWWPLKAALNRHGYNLGDDGDDELAALYRGADDTETLVAAEAFRDDYLETFFVGTNRFVLDEDAGEWWTLFDEDMESRT